MGYIGLSRNINGNFTQLICKWYTLNDFSVIHSTGAGTLFPRK